MTKRIRRFVVGMALVMPSVLLGFSVVQTHHLRDGFEKALEQNQKLLRQNDTLIELLSSSTQKALSELQEMQVADGTHKCR